MNKFMLGAYWDGRRDSLDMCTENAGRLFAGLVEIDPLFSQWYEPGKSRKDSRKRKVDPFDIQRLREILLKRRIRHDTDGVVIEELGFRVALWNGAVEDEDQASIDITCGCYGEYVGNYVTIDLPYKAGNTKWVENASSLLALVAEIWRPEWAGIMSKKAMRARGYDANYPFVDWMVYVPRVVAAVPLPSRIDVLKGLGSIVVVQPDPPVGDDAGELSLIRRVERLLTT